MIPRTSFAMVQTARRTLEGREFPIPDVSDDDASPTSALVAVDTGWTGDEHRLRIAAAKAIWRIGTTREQRTAKRVLLDFVNSTDRSLQVMGALALADINAASNSKAWPILRDIAGEPSPEGQLARSYLRIYYLDQQSSIARVEFADLPVEPLDDGDAREQGQRRQHVLGFGPTFILLGHLPPRRGSRGAWRCAP